MNPLALFTGPQAIVAKWAVIAILVAAFGTFAWVKGDQHGTQKLIDYQGAQAVASIKVITRQAAAGQRVLVKYRDRVRVVKGVETTIEKEVIKYVDSKPLALSCFLDDGWLRIHDAAAAGAVPGATPGTDGATGTPGHDPGPGAEAADQRGPGASDHHQELRIRTPERGKASKLAGMGEKPGRSNKRPVGRLVALPSAETP